LAVVDARVLRVELHLFRVLTLFVNFRFVIRTILGHNLADVDLRVLVIIVAHELNELFLNGEHSVYAAVVDEALLLMYL
jgi:hypothetical protein